MPIRNTLACGDTCVLSRASLGFAAGAVCLSEGSAPVGLFCQGSGSRAPLGTGSAGTARQRRDVAALSPSFPLLPGWSRWLCWLEVGEIPLPPKQHLQVLFSAS